MRRLLRNALVATVGVCALTALAFWGLQRAAQQEPDFYRAAMQVETIDQELAGDKLEQEMLELHNEARQEGRWEAVFADEQLNGWLASDLLEKFPHLLPRGAQDPRVAIAPNQVQVACRYQRGNVETVISCALDVDLTEATNTLAIRISKLRAGALPVPLKRFLDRISQAARRSEIPLRWTVQDGDPLALVTVPAKHEEYAHREIYLETIELREGEIYLAGRTENPDADMLAQHAPVTSEEKERVQR